MGRSLVTAGTLHRKLKSPIMNGNAYHHFLFSDPLKNKLPTEQKLTENLKEIRALYESLQGKKTLPQRELYLGLKMVELSVLKQLSLKYNQHFDRANAYETIGLYEQIWLERNQVGGLFESSQKFRKAFEMMF